MHEGWRRSFWVLFFGSILFTNPPTALVADVVAPQVQLPQARAPHAAAQRTRQRFGPLVANAVLVPRKDQEEGSG